MIFGVDGAAFVPLSVGSLAERFAGDRMMASRVGEDVSLWNVREVGDGNLNLVFIVSGPMGSVVVKQALPYVRMVGESWPLSIRRSYFEYHALKRQADRAPRSVPDVYLFDEDQALFVMEFLSPHVVLRHALIEGRRADGLGSSMGRFLARTLFRGSALHLPADVRAKDLALFAQNVELSEITGNLIFSEPYFDAPMNRHTSPQLDAMVAEMRDDRHLRIEAQKLKQIFQTRMETLLHGDLHTGSIMVCDEDIRVIDAEFATYGPIAFDVGVFLANCWMSFFSQRGHEAFESRDLMRDYLMQETTMTWMAFVSEFGALWRTERFGTLFEQRLFEDVGDGPGSEVALAGVLQAIWSDALGFAGLECHRRILGLAHNADFESIEDPDLRSDCERRVLQFGRYLVMHRDRIDSIAAVNVMAQRLDVAQASRSERFEDAIYSQKA